MSNNYWNCPYRSLDKIDGDEEDEQEHCCTHPDNYSTECCLENKFGSSDEDCEFLEGENIDEDMDEEDERDISDMEAEEDMDDDLEEEE